MEPAGVVHVIPSTHELRSLLPARWRPRRPALALRRARPRRPPRRPRCPSSRPTSRRSATASRRPVSSYADIVEPVEKAVVSIYSSKTIHQRVQANPLLRQFFGDIPDQDRESKEMGLGSGVIVSSDGYILTNNHVVEGADELTVVLSDGRKFTAKVVGADPKTDVAVVKIEATVLPAVTLADSDKLRVGDVVFAVGNPLGVGETVTMGIVSAKSRNVGILDDVAGYEDFIQTDAAINMGNSGGALVDAKGRFVGINSAIVSPSRGNIGIGFAVPVNMAVERHEEPHRDGHGHARVPGRGRRSPDPGHRGAGPPSEGRQGRHRDRRDRGRPGRQGGRQEQRRDHRRQRQAVPRPRRAPPDDRRRWRRAARSRWTSRATASRW